VRLDKRPEYIIKNIWPRGGILEIYGEAGSFKSFLTFEMLTCIARGEPFLGCKVSVPGPVAYIASEATYGALKRVVAYRRHHGLADDADVPLLLIPQVFDLRNPYGDTDRLIAYLNEQAANIGAPLIAAGIDTLSRNFAGGKETTSEDMGAFVRNCDRIREETGAGVGIVHHQGVEHKAGGRGHTSLLAATDAAIHVVKDAKTGLASLTLERMKDGEDGALISFRTKVIEVGKDADDEPQTSLVIVKAKDPL